MRAGAFLLYSSLETSDILVENSFSDAKPLSDRYLRHISHQFGLISHEWVALGLDCGIIDLSREGNREKQNPNRKPSLKLSSKNQKFVDACRAAGLSSPAKRSDLVAVANDLGMKYAPAWIVQNSECRTDERGMFIVPGLNDTIGEQNAEAFDRAMERDKTVPAATSAPKGNPAPVAELSAIRGMTAGAATLIPDTLKTYVPWGNHDTVETVIKSGMFAPMYVTGLSGNGKTTMIMQACARLKRECFRVNITSATDEDDLLGGFRLINGETVWQDGPVVAAMRRGAVLLIDEIDLGTHLMMCLQSVLEGKGVFLKKINEFVTPADGFTIFATANTKGKGSDDGRFAGTNIMNEAMLDRFDWTLEQEYAPKGTEKKILIKKMKAFGNVDTDFAKMLTDWADTIRKAFRDEIVDEIITTRRLENICKAFAIFKDRETAINMALARFDDETATAFRDFYAKMDDTIDTTVNIEDLDDDAILDLSTTYSQKDEVKVRGARWDENARKWTITVDVWSRDRDYWNTYTPMPRG